MTSPTSKPPDAVALQRSRLVAGALVVWVLSFTVVAGFVAPLGTAQFLVFPSGIAGLVSPVIGYRLYLMTRDRIPAEASTRQRCDAFLRAVVLALAVTEGIALVGVVAFTLSGENVALFGVLTHVLLTGAIWPTPEKMEQFLVPDGS